jgi:GNAT superfamily N-acetyltransferase
MYEVTDRSLKRLNSAELEACFAILDAGKAVNLASARRELPCATAVVLATSGCEIVGLGAIKRERRQYANCISKKCGVSIEVGRLELGYIAVHPSHRRQGLSTRIVSLLLQNSGTRLFATTDDDYMKCTLAKAGFVEIGKEWEGKRGRLSLWLKD